MGQIRCKFSNFVLIPQEGITSTSIGENYETEDGVKVRVKYISTWNNSDGEYNEELEDLCMKRWGMTFAFIRSMWISRLPYVGNYWHYVELTKI